jgi:hypothetical protein
MWDGERTEVYHYHFTQEYPYTIGCFHGTPINAQGQQSVAGGSPLDGFGIGPGAPGGPQALRGRPPRGRFPGSRPPFGPRSRG